MTNKLTKNAHYSFVWHNRDKTKCFYSGCKQALVNTQHCYYHAKKRLEANKKHRDSRDKTACIVSSCKDELKTKRYCDKHRLINNAKSYARYKKELERTKEEVKQ